MTSQNPPGDEHEDREVRQIAELMIRAYGAAAPLYALHSADLLLERGDFKTAAQWRRVGRAAEELLDA